jgi:hypothetical protein
VNRFGSKVAANRAVKILCEMIEAYGVAPFSKTCFGARMVAKIVIELAKKYNG